MTLRRIGVFAVLGTIAAAAAAASVEIQSAEPKMKPLLVHTVSGGITGKTRVLSVVEAGGAHEVWRDVYRTESESKPQRIGVLKPEAAKELGKLLDDCPTYRAPKRDNPAGGADIQTHTLVCDSRELSSQWFDTSTKDLPPRLATLVRWLDAIDSQVAARG